MCVPRYEALSFENANRIANRIAIHRRVQGTVCLSDSPKFLNEPIRQMFEFSKSLQWFKPLFKLWLVFSIAITPFSGLPVPRVLWSGYTFASASHQTLLVAMSCNFDDEIRSFNDRQNRGFCSEELFTEKFSFWD